MTPSCFLAEGNAKLFLVGFAAQNGVSLGGAKAPPCPPRQTDTAAPALSEPEYVSKLGGDKAEEKRVRLESLSHVLNNSCRRPSTVVMSSFKNRRSPCSCLKEGNEIILRFWEAA
jgi:hypothetical protein